MVDYRYVTADEANERIDEFKTVYAAVFSQPPYNEGPDMPDKFVGWVRDESAEPGFTMVEAVDADEAVGFAYGYHWPAGRWWYGSDRPAPTEVTVEPTFAVMEWAVLPAHRGQGVGRALMAALLAGRPEPYATLMVNPAAEARVIYERWGWRHVGSTKPGKMPGMDVMVRALATETDQPGSG